MTFLGLLAVLAGAGSAAVALRPRPRLPTREAAPRPARPDQGWMRRHRLLLSVLTGLGVLTFLGGPAGLVGGVLTGPAAWVAIGRAEPPEERRRRAAVRAELPHVVGLLGSALRAGASPPVALAAVCAALPGRASERLAPAVARLDLGVDAGTVWQRLADDPDLGPLGRALGRAHLTGAPVVTSVERLADELAASARATVEDRARAVGVRAAVPLGLCLLPAFFLVGIVPLVAGMLGTLGL